MEKIIVQIYEIQDPEEATALIDIGVDRIGSVILSEKHWKIPGIKDTIRQVRCASATSSLIPLFNSRDSVLRTLEYYQPDIVHFCESLVDQKDIRNYCNQLMKLQKDVKERFPDIQIMRSIPISHHGGDSSVPTLKLAQWFQEVSDIYLTDTILTGESGIDAASQPVGGFVGITGQRCNWETAARLVASSHIPVILAGGISPENVAEGIRRVNPAGVDSCTLTNALDQDGRPIRFKKDPGKVKRLVAAVREAEKGPKEISAAPGRNTDSR